MSYKPVRYDYTQFKKLLLVDTDAYSEYNSLAEDFALISELIRARKKVNKTQQDLAEIMGTSSSVISRLESFVGQKQHSPTMATLKKYAHAVGCKLSIKLIMDPTALPKIKRAKTK